MPMYLFYFRKIIMIATPPSKQALPTLSAHDQGGARRLSVAPMLGWTNRDCRYFFRLLSKHCLLYTEMITSDGFALWPA